MENVKQQTWPTHTRPRWGIIQQAAAWP